MIYLTGQLRKQIGTATIYFDFFLGLLFANLTNLKWSLSLFVFKKRAIQLLLEIISDINGIDEQEVFWIIFKGGKREDNDNS